MKSKSVDAIRARDDWPQIQMRVANGEPYSRIAKEELKIHPQRLKRALDASKRDKVLAAAQPVQETVAKVEEIVRDVTGEVTDKQPDLFANPPTRDFAEISMQGLLQDMQSDQAALRTMAEAHQKDSPMTSIAARKAAIDATVGIMNALVKYNLDAQKDIHNHPGFNRMLTVIMRALEPFPDAMAAVLHAVETAT